MSKYRTVLWVFAMAISLQSFAQENWDQLKWFQQGIGFGCSVNAEMSKPVWEVGLSLAERDFDTIRALLYSDVPGYQFMAVFVLQNLSRKKEIKLEESEWERIEQIKNNGDPVLVCAGCTYWDEVPLKILLDQRKKHVIYKNADSWFRIYYQKK